MLDKQSSEYKFTCLTNINTYSVENWYLQFRLSFKVALGMDGGTAMRF